MTDFFQDLRFAARQLIPGTNLLAQRGNHWIQFTIGRLKLCRHNAPPSSIRWWWCEMNSDPVLFFLQ